MIPARSQRIGGLHQLRKALDKKPPGGTPWRQCSRVTQCCK